MDEENKSVYHIDTHEVKYEIKDPKTGKKVLLTKVQKEKLIKELSEKHMKKNKQVYSNLSKR